MMVSDDEMALKALLAVTGRPGWQADAPRMMIGAALRQSRGHWDTTPANAWGTIATRRFATAYATGTPTGTTRMTLGAATASRAWPFAPDAPPLRLPLPAAPGRLLIAHAGAPTPWATVAVRAAVLLAAPSFAGYRIGRTVSFIQQAHPGQISRGDVLKVRITVDAPVDRTWVVIEDPVPAGASIVGGQGGQSQIIADQANGGDSPSYVERGLDYWRGYFGWLPKGQTSVEYAVRINGAGRFQLPPTRVEAMYSPEIHAALPNRTMVVQ
jgi:alpha-2-macroglobulin